MSSTQNRIARRRRQKAFEAFKRLTPEQQAAELARVKGKLEGLRGKVERVATPPDVHPMCSTGDEVRWQVKAHKMGAALPAWARATRKALAEHLPAQAGQIEAIATGTIAWIEGCPFEVVDEPAVGEPEVMPS